MMGAAVITLVSEVIVLGAIIWYTRDVSTRILGHSFGRALLPTVIMAVAVLPFRDQIAAFVIGPVVYGVASLATRAVPIADARRLAGEFRGNPASGLDDGDGR